MIPYILLFVGLLLIFVEFFLPGGVLAIAGGVLLVLSIVYFAVQSTSGVAVLLFTIGTILLLGILVKFTLWRMRKGHLAKSIFLGTHQEGFMASTFDKAEMGKSGVALNDLKPAGHILVESKRLQAVAKVGYIPKGSHVKIIGGEGAHFIVIEQKETP
jgi:membrane-bound ClpP family serine protease